MHRFEPMVHLGPFRNWRLPVPGKTNRGPSLTPPSAETNTILVHHGIARRRISNRSSRLERLLLIILAILPAQKRSQARDQEL